MNTYYASGAAEATQTEYLQLPEGKIGYDVAGEGPLVVLVPGMGDLRSGYRFLAPALRAAGYRVACTDLRGHGDSDATFGRYGDVETAGDVSALIEKLGGSAVIVGNSLAAGAAALVAAEHPDRVTGLVLVGPFVRNPKVNALMMGVFRAMMAPLWVAASWKAYMPTLYAGQKPADFDAYRASVIASLRRPGYAKAFSLTTRQTDHAPVEARLPDVAAPVLVIMGERDPDFTDPAAEARWIGETLHAEVVMVPEAGHYPQSQQPEIVTPVVLAFLQSVLHRA
ncbi:alpha/beta fold hydrolase [Subtercola vilae]|uniref:Alpha/beta hydrolase n=1 Tax=Subtercola vilae TaxID=2056433 RepID=A0A4T2BET5_9MICO|nr:alpha/beta hydrolase [Subtercola vilae]TIH29069.1 alpha/beta hydrolase [Subtercola vilae]